MARLGLLLSSDNAGGRTPDESVSIVMLERTLIDPPRQAAMTRWCSTVRRRFPAAELIPVAWHLVTHSREDGLRSGGQRRPEGNDLCFGGLQNTAEVEQAWQVTRQCMAACGTNRVVLRTGASLSPGALGRKRLREFVAKHREGEIGFCWEPGGLWDEQVAVSFAKELDVCLFFPGFAGGRPRLAVPGSSLLVGRDAWIRVDGVGSRSGINAVQIDALLDHLDHAPDSTFIFAGIRAAANLRRFANEAGITVPV